MGQNVRSLVFDTGGLDDERNVELSGAMRASAQGAGAGHKSPADHKILDTALDITRLDDVHNCGQSNISGPYSQHHWRVHSLSAPKSSTDSTLQTRLEKGDGDGVYIKLTDIIDRTKSNPPTATMAARDYLLSSAQPCPLPGSSSNRSARAPAKGAGGRVRCCCQMLVMLLVTFASISLAADVASRQRPLPASLSGQVSKINQTPPTSPPALSSTVWPNNSSQLSLSADANTSDQAQEATPDHQHVSAFHATQNILNKFDIDDGSRQYPGHNRSDLSLSSSSSLSLSSSSSSATVTTPATLASRTPSLMNGSTEAGNVATTTATEALMMPSQQRNSVPVKSNDNVHHQHLNDTVISVVRQPEDGEEDVLQLCRCLLRLTVDRLRLVASSGGGGSSSSSSSSNGHNPTGSEPTSEALTLATRPPIDLDLLSAELLSAFASKFNASTTFKQDINKDKLIDTLHEGRHATTTADASTRKGNKTENRKRKRIDQRPSWITGSVGLASVADDIVARLLLAVVLPDAVREAHSAGPRANKQNNNNNKNSSWDELRASPESKCRLNVTPATRSAIEPIVTTLVARSMAKVIDRQANERQEHANAREQQQAQQQQQQLDSTNCHNRRSKSESQGCPENVSPLVIAHPGPTFVRAKRIGSIQHRQPPRTVFATDNEKGGSNAASLLKIPAATAVGPESIMTATASAAAASAAAGVEARPEAADAVTPAIEQKSHLGSVNSWPAGMETNTTTTMFNSTTSATNSTGGGVRLNRLWWATTTAPTVNASMMPKVGWHWNASNDARPSRPLGQVQSLRRANETTDSWSDQSPTSATTTTTTTTTGGTSIADFAHFTSRISLMTSTQPSLATLHPPSNDSAAADYANEDQSTKSAETSTISSAHYHHPTTHAERHLNISAGSLNTDKIVSNNYETVDGNDDGNNRNTSILYNNDKMGTKASVAVEMSATDNNKANNRMSDDDGGGGAVDYNDDKKEGKFLNATTTTMTTTTTTPTLSDRSAIRMASTDKHLTSNDKVSTTEGGAGPPRAKHCPPGVDSKWNLTWAKGDAGFTAMTTCPAPYAGVAHRTCAADGRWHETDPSGCRLKPLELVCILVHKHVERHLYDDLFLLTVQMEQMLDGTPLFSPADRYQALNTFELILRRMRSKIRFDHKTLEATKMLLFVKSLVTICDRLVISSQRLAFLPLHTLANQTRGSLKESNNALMNNKILTTLEAFRLAMESLLRALILADEDGSIKYLQAVLAQPKPTPPPESHLTKGDNIDASNMARRQQTPAAAARKVYANNIDMQLNLWKHSRLDKHFLLSEAFGKSLPPNEVGKMPELRIESKEDTHLGVGVMQAWLHDSADSVALDNVIVASDLLLVSIVPAISIEVDFESLPTFVATFPLDRIRQRVLVAAETSSSSSSSSSPQPSARLICGRIYHKSEGNKRQARDRAHWTENGCRLAEQMSLVKSSQLECWCNQTGVIALLLIPSIDCLHDDQATDDSGRRHDESPTTTSGFYDYEQQQQQQQQQLYRYGHYHQPTSKPHINGVSAFFSVFHLSHHFTLYVSLVVSVFFLLVTLGVQYRMRCFEQREVYFVLRNLVIALLLIELTFLFGTTLHMDLFWAHMANWTSTRPTGNDSTQVKPMLVHAKHILCLSVPIFLHFIHLATLFWMFSFTILLFQRLRAIRISCQKASLRSDNPEAASTAAEISFKSPYEDNLAGAVSHRHRKRYLQQRSFNRTKKKFKLFGTRIVVGLLQWLWRAPKCLKRGGSLRTSTGMRRTETSDEGVPMRNIAHVMPTFDEPPPNNVASLPEDDHEPQNNSTTTSSLQQPRLSSPGWRCEHFLALSLGVPFVLVLLSYLLSPKGYETRRYCWMSIEGGILYSFIVPVVTLLSANTFLMLLVLKRYFEQKHLFYRAGVGRLRPTIRSCLTLLPLFILNWFFSILSLEPLATSLFEHIFAFTNCLLAILIFYFYSYQRYKKKINYLMPVGYIRSRSRRRLTQLMHGCPWLAQSIERCLCCLGLGRRAVRARGGLANDDDDDDDVGQDSTIDLTDRLETLRPSLQHLHQHQHHHNHHHPEHLQYYHRSPDDDGGASDQFHAEGNLPKEMTIEEHQQRQQSSRPEMIDRGAVVSAASSSSSTDVCRLHNADPRVFQGTMPPYSGRARMRFKFDDEDEEEELVIVELNDDFMIEDFISDDFEEEDDDDDDDDDDDIDVDDEDLDIHPDDVKNYLAKTF